MRKLYAAVLFLALSFSFCRAQYVTIPDANFVTWLKANGYNACMNGNQLDTTCDAVMWATNVQCFSQSIVNLTGIAYFDNLKTLEVGDNLLTTLGNRLPAGLTKLDVYRNELTSLPPLPNTIKDLSTSSNPLLQTLPVLPTALEILVCSSNSLSGLPTLPSGLKELYCNANVITLMPALPAGLTRLNCASNKLTDLPILPASLTWLVAYSNKLVSLPTLPAGLKTLSLSSNYNILLPATFPAALDELLIGSCNLSVANFTLPAALNKFDCYNNNLTQLPTLHSGLTILDCRDNNLKQLPTLPAMLDELRCSQNQLTSLPPLPDSMSYVSVIDNPKLTCFPVLKKFTGPPAFFSIAKNTGITCLSNVIQHTRSSVPAIDTMPICGPCGVPVFHFGKIATATAVILWTRQECITNYRIAYRVKGTSTWTTVVSGPLAVSRILNSLSPGTTYEVRMRVGCTPSTLSAWAAIQTFTTDKVCNAPTGITVTNVKKDRATLNWATMANAYSYKIRYRKLGTSVWSNQTAIAPVVHKVLTGLSNNTTYEYQLLTVCDTTGAQASPWTVTQTFNTLLRLEGGEEASAELNIYPNPATSQLTLATSQSLAGTTVFITDMLGRTVVNHPLAANHQIINMDISHLAPGVYFIRLEGAETGAKTAKFVKK